MSSESLGRVKAPSGKTFEVKWDAKSRDVYVAVAGWTHCGKASSAGEAMRKAEAHVHSK